jgi:DNA-binding response OmpR family regulator
VRPNKKIPLCGVDEESLGILRYTLTQYPYSVKVAYSSQEALGWIRGEQFDLLLCDYSLPQLDQLLARAKLIDESMRSIIMNARRQDTMIADTFLIQFTIAELLRHIRVSVMRKRGPRNGFKKPPQAEWFTLPVEKKA